MCERGCGNRVGMGWAWLASTLDGEDIAMIYARVGLGDGCGAVEGALVTGSVSHQFAYGVVLGVAGCSGERDREGGEGGDGEGGAGGSDAGNRWCLR